MELLFPQSQQSFCIKVGNCIEKCFKEYILSKGIELFDKIEIKNEGVRQADLFFIYKNKKYYFEIKNNINLDTEKAPAVLHKLNGADVDIKGVLIFRFDKKENCFIHKCFDEYVYGYNDFFSIFNDELTAENFEKILNLLRRKYYGTNI